MTDNHDPKPYWNPYLAGFLLGLVLLTAFVTMGRGLGASSAIATAAGTAVAAVAPDYAAHHPYFAEYAAGHPFQEWLVLEVLGVAVGGLLSGLLGNRVRRTIERGPRTSPGPRLALAFIGGGLMAMGAKIALGCASGQALTGGSLLNAGSWAFMMAMFGAAYGLAFFLRKQWL